MKYKKGVYQMNSGVEPTEKYYSHAWKPANEHNYIAY